MDNCCWHNAQKVVDKIKHSHMIRLDHPLYSPDLSACDFYFFGVLKNQMKETVFRNVDEVEDFVCNFWSEVTSEKVQLVLRESMGGLEWVCEHDGEYVLE
jgi:hypothetical protein